MSECNLIKWRVRQLLQRLGCHAKVPLPQTMRDPWPKPTRQARKCMAFHPCAAATTAPAQPLRVNWEMYEPTQSRPMVRAPATPTILSSHEGATATYDARSLAKTNLTRPPMHGFPPWHSCNNKSSKALLRVPETALVSVAPQPYQGQ
jgi:hypothetical protein